MKGEYIENFERYKDIIKKPYNVGDLKVYEVEFLGLNELYNFLISNPPINTDSFSKVRSQDKMSTDSEKLFYELTYDDALKYLLGGYERNIDKLFELTRSLQAEKRYSKNKTKVIRAQTGSRVCINGFVSNSPKKFYRLERMEEKKFVRVHANMSFTANDNVNKVLHKGALLKNLVDLLEANNYSVGLNTFILLERYGEVFYFKLHIKNVNSALHLQDMIYPLTSVAFLRRLVFRVMESVPFQGEEWSNNYGAEIYEDEVKRILNISQKDIYVGSPSQMKLEGVSLEEDANSFLKYVNADNYIRVLKK